MKVKINIDLTENDKVLFREKAASLLAEILMKKLNNDSNAIEKLIGLLEDEEVNVGW